MLTLSVSLYIEQANQLHLWLSRTHHGHPDGQVPGHRLCLWLAKLFHRLLDR